MTDGRYVEQIVGGFFHHLIRPLRKIAAAQMQTKGAQRLFFGVEAGNRLISAFTGLEYTEIPHGKLLKAVLQVTEIQKQNVINGSAATAYQILLEQRSQQWRFDVYMAFSQFHQFSFGTER